MQTWVDPWVESDRYLALFRIKVRGINYDIHDLYQEKDGNQFYEFWLIQVAATEWSVEHDRSEFSVVRTDDIYVVWKFVKKSDRFIEPYSVAGRQIRLPLNDLELLYDMQAWLLPGNYKGSIVINKKVIMDDQGDISLVQ